MPSAKGTRSESNLFQAIGFLEASLSGEELSPRNANSVKRALWLLEAVYDAQSAQGSSQDIG
jgi:hypothetical protein